MSSALPKDLPRTLALFVALPVLAFGFGGMITEALAGRPSSTSSVGIVFIPFFATALGVGAYVLGVVLRWPWRRFGWRTWESPRVERTLLAALGMTCVLAAVAPVALVLHHEARARPRVLHDTGVVQRMPLLVVPGWPRSAATRVAHGGAPGRASFSVGDVVVTSEGVAFVPAGSGRDVVLDVDALDYIREVFAAPLDGPTAADDLLAVLIDGSATGKRALLVAFDRKGTLVFEELLERSWPIQEEGLAIVHDPAAHVPDVVVVASGIVLVHAKSSLPR